jgi:hypothetical protein
MRKVGVHLRRRSAELKVEKQTNAPSRAADMSEGKKGRALPQGSQSMKSNTRTRRKAAALVASWRMTAAVLRRAAVLRLEAATLHACGQESEAMQ